MRIEGEGEWKLMEKRHEDYYRLISSETDDDDDRKLEGGNVMSCDMISRNPALSISK